MKSSDQAESGGDWRVRLGDMRTFAALRAEAPAPDAAERLTDRALQAAAINPDHSEAGRSAARQAMRARNVTEAPWRVRAPGFLSARDLAKGERAFFGFERSFRLLCASLAVIFLSIAALFVVWFVTSVSLAVVAPGALPFAAVVLLAPLAAFVLLSLLRTKPARITVLRPRATPSVRAPLRRMMARELRAFGHVISLAPETGGVHSAARYRVAVRGLRHLFALNLRNALPGGATRAWRATDAWRPFLLQALTDSSDALVIDLTDGETWAPEVIASQRARCVFVALWGKLDEAQAALVASGVNAPVFAYAPDGEIQRRRQFRAALIAAMRATHGVSA